jgi:hypothetical protein
LAGLVAAGFSPAPFISGTCPPKGGLYEHRRRFFHTFWRPGLRYVAPSELNSEAEFLNEFMTQHTSLSVTLVRL